MSSFYFHLWHIINEIEYTLIKSVRLWNFKDGGSLNARFLPKNQHAQRIFFKQSYNELWFVKKVPKFLCKIFFSNFNFWTTLFSKIMSNFWWTVTPCILKILWFPLSILIFGQKSWCLGPTIFKIPQPNWY